MDHVQPVYFCSALKRPFTPLRGLFLLRRSYDLFDKEAMFEDQELSSTERPEQYQVRNDRIPNIFRL